MTDIKDLTKPTWYLLRDELKSQHPEAKRVSGVDVHYVNTNRNVREVPDGEPKALLFAGNPYAIVYVNKLVWVLKDNTRQVITLQAVRNAWDIVKWNHIPNDIITIDGKEHVLLDPQITDDGRLMFGFTGLTTVAKPTVKPAFPQF